MKKKVGLITLFMTGAATFTLASCGNQQVQDNADSISALQTRIAALESQLTSTKTTLTETINTSIQDLKTELTATNAETIALLTEAIVNLNAEGTEKNNETAAEIQTSMQGIVEDVTALETSLNADIAELETAIQTLETNSATKAELADAKAALEDKLATKEALEAAKTELQTKIDDVEARIKAGSVTEADLQEAVAALEKVDSEIKTEVENHEARIKDIEDKYAKQTDLDALQAATEIKFVSANAAVTKNAEDIKALDSKVTTLQGVITQINTDLESKVNRATYDLAIQELKDVDTKAGAELTNLANRASALETKVKALEAKDEAIDAEIEKINDLIGTISEEDESTDTIFARIYAIEAQIKALGTDTETFISTLDDFYGDEAKTIKTDYVYTLAMSYSNYQIEMQALRNELIKLYGESETVKDVYDSMESAFNFEMQGYLNKGIVEITLAKNAKEAETAYNTYKDQLESYTYEAKFLVKKGTIASRISSAESMPDEMQTKLANDVKAITYDSEELAEATLEQIKAYYTERSDKLDLISAKTTAIDDIYDTLESTIKELDNLAEFKDTTLVATFAASMTEKISADAYYELTTKDAVVKLNKEDFDELKIVAAQAVTFNTLLKTIKDTNASTDNLKNPSGENKTTVKTDITDVANEAKLKTYMALTTNEDIKKQYETDTTLISHLFARISNYDAAVTYANNAAKSYEELKYVLGENLTAVKASATSIPVFDEYYKLTLSDNVVMKYDSDKEAIDFVTNKAKLFNNVLLNAYTSNVAIINYPEISEENAEKFTTAIGMVPSWKEFAATKDMPGATEVESTQVAKITLYQKQALAYSEMLVYAKDKNDKIEKFELPSLDQTAAQNAVNIIDFAKYYDVLADDDAIKAQKDADTAVIDLAFYQASAFNQLYKYAHDSITAVEALSVQAVVKETITTEMNGKLVVTNYVNDTLTNNELVDDKLAEDMQAIELLKAKAKAFDDLLTYAKTSCDTVDAQKYTTEAEEKEIKVLINAIPQSENYLATTLTSFDSVKAQLDKDKAAIGVIVAKSTSYDNAREYDKAKETLVSALPNIGTDAKSINIIIEEVVVYDNYIRNEEYEEQLITDKEAIDAIVTKATNYSAALTYAVENKKVVNALPQLTNDIVKESEESDKVETIYGEKTNINILIDAVVKYAKYFGENASTDTAKQLTEDKAAIDVIVNQAKAYSEGKVYAQTAVTTVEKLENVTNKEDIIAAINEVVVYDNYIEDDNYAKNLTADKAEIDLLVAQENAYDQALKYVSTNNTTVKKLTSVGETDITAITGLITDVVKFTNYDGKTAAEATTQLATDKAAIDTLVSQAIAYNTARGYETTNKTKINALERISDEDRKLALDALALIVKYDSYINNEKYSDNLTADKDAVELVHAKAYTYDALLKLMDTTVTNVNSLTNLTEDTYVLGEELENILVPGEKSNIATLIYAVADFKTSYLNNAKLTDTTTVSGQFEVDKTSVQLYYTQAVAYDGVKGHADEQYTKNVANLEIDADVISAVKDLIYAVPKYDSYIDKLDATSVTTKSNEDKNQIELYVQQVTKFAEAVAYRTTIKNNIDKLELLTSDVTDDNVTTPGEKTTIKALVDNVFAYTDYIDKLATVTAIDAKFTADKNSMDAIYNKAKEYDEALAFVISNQDKIINIKWNDKSNLTDEQIKAAKDKMSDVVKYDNYFGENYSATTLTANKAAITLIYDQVYAYSDVKNTSNTALAAYAAVTSNIAQTEDEAYFLTAIEAIPVFNKYLGGLADATAIGNQKTNDLNDITLLSTELSYYNNIVGMLTTNKTAIDALEYLESIGVETETSRKTAIKAAMDEIVTFANYTAEAATADSIKKQYETDSATITLLFNQANAYNTVVKAALDGVSKLETTYNNITTETEVKAINDMFKAVPDYSLYVGHLKADEIETKKKADLDAIALILYKTEMYSTTITNATDLVTKLTESYANVNHAEYNKVFNYVVDSINAVPVYSNYFEAGLLDNASVKKVYDADADKLGLYKTTMDEYVLLFNTYQTAYKTVSEFTHLGTKETINDIETTAYEVYLARLDAYVNKDNVVAAIKDMTAKQITEFATKAKAEVATIVTSAQTLDEINEYLYDETDGKIAIITNLKNLDDELKQKFIDKISLYATYVNHISLTSTFTTETQFTKYLSDAKTKAESTGTIATSEDSNVYEVNQAITTITTNYTTEKISEELKDYLLAVVANIYENNTNVDITSVIVATSRQNTLKSQIDAVTASINTFINVDTAISKLDSDMYEFVFAARSEFITNHTDSATATKIFDSHAEEIEAKEDEIMYTYIIPESFTYADFATFRDSLKTTGQINDLIKTFQAWYVNELLETMEAEYTEATTPATEDPAE